MKAIAIIPARYASTRLPGKMLLDRTGKPLIAHVIEAVGKARKLDDIVVATDDERILRAAHSAGAKAVMTRVDHRCGTDRLAEAAEKLGLAQDDIVVNVQGDEPDMPADCIDTLVELMRPGHVNGRPGHFSDPGDLARDIPMATLAAPLAASEVDNPNRVKVVLAADGRAMYFSRARIPFDRDGSGGVDYLLHLGIYAYRVWFLQRFTTLAPTPAEQAEKLEQLRALEHGYAIKAAVVTYAGGGIDTPEDYAAFVARVRGA